MHAYLTCNTSSVCHSAVPGVRPGATRLGKCAVLELRPSYSVNSYVTLFPSTSLWPCLQSSLRDRQDQTHNLWDPGQNEYALLLVQKLLRISRRRWQNIDPAATTCDTPMICWRLDDRSSRLCHLPVGPGASHPAFQSLPGLT